MKNNNSFNLKNIKEYNYKHFKPSDYNFINFDGPKAGQKYIDFEATTIDGKIVSLSDYLDKPIVLETGSITCPMYANAKQPMNILQEKYPEINFLLLYVREAHPGGKTKPTTSIEEKIANAKSTQQIYNEKRTILVDSLKGNAHKLYGTMPNMTYVIGMDGIIKLRADWTNIEALKKVLLDINTNKIETKDRYKISNPSLLVVIKTLLIGGISALYEFIIGLLKMQKLHKQSEPKI